MWRACENSKDSLRVPVLGWAPNISTPKSLDNTRGESYIINDNRRTDLGKNLFWECLWPER